MTDIDNVIVGARLPPLTDRRLIREYAEVQISEVAKAVGVHRSSVLRWERGEREPRGRNRRRYAAVLDEIRRQSEQRS